MSMRRLATLLAVLTLAAPLMFYGCSGDDGSTGATGLTGDTGDTGPAGQDLIATAKPETCAICHSGAGDNHQASYDVLYQDNVIKATISGVTVNPDNTVAVSFNMTKNGADFSCKDADNLNIYFTEYDNTLNRFQFASGQDRLSIKGTSSNIVYGGAGLCTSTATLGDNAALLANPGVVVVYGYDEQVGSIPSPSRVKQVKYPYAALFYNAAYASLPNQYVSAANVKGCEKCHTVPYLKHGNIYGRVKGVAATDMYTCKACHLDNGEGGHQFWQELVDDPEMAARDWNKILTAADNAFIAANYGYKTRLMNDVHMSHAMEFEYPQSMATCNTCHEGKLGQILTDANFTAETCKSCHPVTGSAASEKPQPALEAIWAEIGVAGFHDIGMTCNAVGCHVSGGIGKVFNAIHTGYDKKIYTAAGAKFSSGITVTIDNASFADNQLTFGFHAAGTAGGLNATAIVPTVMVGLYGYDTKDYIVGPHEGRQLEYALNGTNTRFTTVSAGNGAWVVRADLTTWNGMIAAGSVKRAEIAVMPRLEDPALPKSPSGDNVVALNAPSRTFSFVTNGFVDNFYPAIVKVADGCNNCHDALAVNFHTPDRGGNIVVCRLCHITKSGGSHLEMQSRSIDSYAHAIHSFQAFDYGRALTSGGVDFSDPVQSMFYDLKIESHFPTFDITNCESCHVEAKFNVPDQAKSLPGILSASWDNLVGWNRTIGGVPAYVTGPASRACGACHRAEMIKEDAAAELAAFNQHTKDGGYLLTPGDIPTLVTAINAVLPQFNDGIMVVLP